MRKKIIFTRHIYFFMWQSHIYLEIMAQPLDLSQIDLEVYEPKRTINNSIAYNKLATNWIVIICIYIIVNISNCCVPTKVLQYLQCSPLCQKHYSTLTCGAGNVRKNTIKNKIRKNRKFQGNSHNRLVLHMMKCIICALVIYHSYARH